MAQDHGPTSCDDSERDRPPQFGIRAPVLLLTKLLILLHFFVRTCGVLIVRDALTAE
jgi:hypothetical protein